MKSMLKMSRVSRRSLSAAGWRVALIGGAAALTTGCAQFQKSVTQPSPLSQGFSHPLLADRNPYYPALTPAAPTATGGNVAYGEQVASPGARPLRAGESASRADRSSMTRDVADAEATRADGSRGAGTARIEEVGGLGFTGQAPESDGADGGVIIGLAPERPRAPKATSDRGLGDPGAGDAVTEPVAAQDTTETVPDFDPAFVAPDFQVDETAAVAPERQPDSSKAVKDDDRRPNAPTRDSRPRPAAPRASAPAAVSTSRVAGLGDGTVSGEVLAAAQRLVGVRTPFDEARFLAHLLSAADLALASGDSGETYIRSVREQLAAQGRVFGAAGTPRPGDLVFFANTFDRDADGRADDWFTMAAVVESVDDGDIVFIGVFQGEVRRMQMNLSRPSAVDDGAGEPLNSALRERSLSDRPFTKYLAGELFAEFGRLAD
ncbi:MAG: hypothetical protein IV100_09305 [Myxococcales bacterium]|nr:hypothetical protein [Myxococcales bacterium]